MSGFALNSAGGFRAVNGPDDAGPDESFSLTEPPAFIAPVDLPAVVAAERYKREIAGITFNGMRIDTDDRSKTLITGSAIKAMRNDNYTLKWKTPTGFVDLSAGQVLLIADAVSDHVQACFDRESQLLGALTDGTFTLDLLSEGWPV